MVLQVGFVVVMCDQCCSHIIIAPFFFFFVLLLLLRSSFLCCLCCSSSSFFFFFFFLLLFCFVFCFFCGRQPKLVGFRLSYTAQGDKRYTTVPNTTKACAQTSQGTRSAHSCKRVVSYCSAEPVTVTLGLQDAPGGDSFAANKRRCVRPKWKTSSCGFLPLHFCCRWRGLEQVLTAPSKVRNVGVIAHVDHGKTTLVDKLLATALGKSKEAGTQSGESERLMDSMELEQERGITIMSKATRVDWKGHTINIVDTPGHADFGGEVERILTMVDSVVLLCDATEGPMAQTKFVLSKSLNRGLKPMTILNKADRPTARLDGSTESELFDLFAALDATDEQLDYPTLYASAIKNWVTDDPDVAKEWAEDVGGSTQGMEMILDQIIDHVPALPEEDDASILNQPFSLAVNNIGKDPFVGSLATGKFTAEPLVSAI